MSLACLSLLLACGSEDDGGSSDDTSGSTGSTGNTGDDQETTSVCSGAVASVPKPYMADTAIEEYGGFFADAQGAVFSVIPNPSDSAYDASADDPNLLMASDLSGGLTTLYTYDSMPGPIVAHGSDVYFVSGLLGLSLLRISRQGGEPTTIADSYEAGLATDGTTLYYFQSPELGSKELVALDMATGESQSLTARTTQESVTNVRLDGTTLYWLENSGTASDPVYELYSLPVAGGEAQHRMTLPAGMGTMYFQVVDGTAYSVTFTDDLAAQLHRATIGQSSFEVADDAAGPPLVIAGTNVFYNGGDALIRNTLALDARTVVSGTSGLSISAIALAPSAVWYADGGCIYRSSL